MAEGQQSEKWASLPTDQKELLTKRLEARAMKRKAAAEIAELDVKLLEKGFPIEELRVQDW